MACTLRDRLADLAPVPPRTQERWVLQLAGAAAWLEGPGWAHGDLRPANVLRLCPYSRIISS